jgi:uncharacterized PurR-regulated membrane protein YhhQ (DUF165 family)
MGYHERTSWAALLSFPVGTVTYWWLVERQTVETGFWETMPTLSTIILSIVATIVFTVIAVVIATIATGADESRPDEREKLIELRGGYMGYWALNILIIVPVWLFFLDLPKATLFHAIILASTGAGMVEHATQVIRHRIGA